MRDFGLPPAVLIAAISVGSLLVYALIRAGIGRRDRIRESYASESLPQCVRNLADVCEGQITNGGVDLIPRSP